MNIRKNNELRNVLIVVGFLLALAAMCAGATPAVGNAQTNWTGPLVPLDATEHWAANSPKSPEWYTAPAQDMVYPTFAEKQMAGNVQLAGCDSGGYGYSGRYRQPAVRYPGNYRGGYYDDGYYGGGGRNYRWINPNRVRVYSPYRNGITVYGGVSARWDNDRGWRPAYDPRRYHRHR